MIVRCTSLVPPAIDAAFDHSHWRCQKPAPGLSSAPHHSGAAAPTTSSARADSAWVMSVHASLVTLDSGPGSMPFGEPRQRAPVVQAQHPQLDERLREPVGDLDVVEHAALGGELPQLVEVHLVDDLLLERERGAALVRERRVRDRPSVVQPADEMVVGHEHLVEEHLVELGVAGDLHERPHLDAGRLHVDDEVRDALVLRRVGIGAREADPPPRELRVRRPHLLPREQPAVVDRARRASAATRGRSRRRAR